MSFNWNEILKSCFLQISILRLFRYFFVETTWFIDMHFTYSLKYYFQGYVICFSDFHVHFWHTGILAYIEIQVAWYQKSFYFKCFWNTLKYAYKYVSDLYSDKQNSLSKSKKNPQLTDQILSSISENKRKKQIFTLFSRRFRWNLLLLMYRYVQNWNTESYEFYLRLVGFFFFFFSHYLFRYI